MYKWNVVRVFSLLFSLNSSLAIAANQNQSPPTGTMNSQSTSERTLTDCETNLLKSRYTFLPETRPELYGARNGAAVISKRGELFAIVHQAARTGVYSFNKGKFTTSADGSLEQVSDLFEARSGRMYFGYLTMNELKIYDARTGQALMSKPLREIDHIGDLMAQLGGETPLYRPFFFENGAGVHVALVPRSDDLYLDEAFTVPVATLNLRTGESNAVSLHSGMIRYERMRDGHVYGVGWQREMGGPPNTLLVYDLNLRKTILSEKFEHQQDPPIISGPLNLFFKTPRQPELVMHLQSPTGKVMVYDRANRRFQPLPGLSRDKTVSIQFFNDEHDKPWFAAIEGSGSTGLAPEFYSMVIQPMGGINGAAIVDLEVENPLNEISGIEVLEKPEGRLFLAWERTVLEGRVRYARVHIYDSKTHQLHTVSIPPEWPGAIRKKSFWDSSRNSILTYFLRGDESTPEFAFITNTIETPPTAPR